MYSDPDYQIRDERMARLRRFCPPGIAQHTISRGNNRQPCFASARDFAGCVYWLRESLHRHPVAIHAWVFTTNHVPILATPHEPGRIARMTQWLGRQHKLVGVIKLVPG